VAYLTFGDLSAQVQKELDIEAEEFIQPEELIGYFNSAIRIIEAEIVKLGLREKYLQSEAYISTVSGQQDYDLPSDIIDTKIRKLVYRDGTIVYTLLPLKGEESYEAEDVLNLYSSSEYYHYVVYKVGTTYKLRLVPKAVKSVTNAIRIIYFKDLNRYTADSVECDVPEICYEYLLSYIRYRCYAKETHVNAAGEQGNLNSLLQLMRETLQGQVADPEVELIDQDLSHYGESS
jgi:hypothetical protein